MSVWSSVLYSSLVLGVAVFTDTCCSVVVRGKLHQESFFYQNQPFHYFRYSLVLTTPITPSTGSHLAGLTTPQSPSTVSHQGNVLLPVTADGAIQTLVQQVLSLVQFLGQRKTLSLSFHYCSLRPVPNCALMCTIDTGARTELHNFLKKKRGVF